MHSKLINSSVILVFVFFTLLPFYFYFSFFFEVRAFTYSVLLLERLSLACNHLLLDHRRHLLRRRQQTGGRRLHCRIKVIIVILEG